MCVSVLCAFFAQNKIWNEEKNKINEWRQRTFLHIFNNSTIYFCHEVAIVTETSCTYNMYMLFFYVCAYMKISGRLKMDVRTLTSVTVVDNTLHKAIARERACEEPSWITNKISTSTFRHSHLLLFIIIIIIIFLDIIVTITMNWYMRCFTVCTSI